MNRKERRAHIKATSRAEAQHAADAHAAGFTQPDAPAGTTIGENPVAKATMTIADRIAAREKKLNTRKCFSCHAPCPETSYCSGCDKAFCPDCRVNPHDLSRYKHQAEDHLSPFMAPRKDDEEDD